MNPILIRKEYDMDMNRGYSGWSRSVRAAQAECDGKLPRTRAAERLMQYGYSRRAAIEALDATGPCEAHHTGKVCRLTDYYDLEQARGWLIARPLLAKIEASAPDWKERINAAISAAPDTLAGRLNAAQPVYADLAEETGLGAGTVKHLYYGCWESIQPNED